MADEPKKKLTRAEKKEAKKKAKEAKKNGIADPNEEEDEDSKGSGILVALIAVLIIAVWLAIFALLVKADVGGFGSTVLYPVLKDVPVINKILPETENSASKSSTAKDSAYNFKNMDEAVARVKELESELASAKSSDSSTQAQLAELQAEAKELQTYKDKEAEFEAEKKKFDEEVVFSDKAPDIEEYKTYYESIDADNAAAIYKEVIEQQQTDSKISDYAKTYSSMKASQAAGIFDTMTDNLSLVAQILNAMDASSRGAILGAMNASTAAQVTKIMNPSSSSSTN